MFELKPLSPSGVPAALEKAERYRLLNEPLDQRIMVDQAEHHRSPAVRFDNTQGYCGNCSSGFELKGRTKQYAPGSLNGSLNGRDELLQLHRRGPGRQRSAGVGGINQL